MAIRRRTLVYDGPGGPFEGVLAWDDAATEARPGVMIVPNVLGQKEFDNVKAEALAELGYVGLAADVFGQGKRAVRGEANHSRFIEALNADRPLLRDRLHGSLAVLKAQPEVDAAKTAAIGYCFGGKSVIDLARSGAEVLGVVAFHGLYDRPNYDSVLPIRAKLLICHGWEDPLAPPEAVTGLAAELTESGADWQIHAYGHAGHGFTDPEAPAGKQAGFGYDANADRRSWAVMESFLAELFA
jgi:dienelactone hydrolase